MKYSNKISMIYGLFYGSRMLTGAINAVFLLNSGLEMRYIAILQSIVTIGTFLLEIPTGYFSDKFSQKFSSVFGIILMGIHYFFMSFSPNILLLVVAEVILALSGALLSGSFEAWVMYTVQKEFPNEPIKIDYYNCLKDETNFFSTMFFGFLGSLIAYFNNGNYRIVYYVCSLFIVFVFILSLFIPSEKIYKAKLLPFSFMDIFLVIKNKIIILFIIIEISFVCTYQVVFFYWQPFFSIILKDKSFFNYKYEESLILGIVFLSYSGIRGIMTRFTRKYFLKKNIWKLVIFNVFLAIVSMLVFTYLDFSNIIIYIVAFSLVQGSIAVSSVLINSKLIQEVPENMISTSLSCISTISSIFSAGMLLVISKNINMQNLLIYFRFCIFIYILIIIEVFCMKSLKK